MYILWWLMKNGVKIEIVELEANNSNRLGFCSQTQVSKQRIFTDILKSNWIIIVFISIF